MSGGKKRLAGNDGHADDGRCVPCDPPGQDGGVGGTTSTGSGAAGEKCTVCGRRAARKFCTRQACSACCSDPDCEPHAEARAAAARQQSLLDGTDPVTAAARRKRSKKVAPGRFAEDSIHYLGDTVCIWDVNEFLSNRKWREDAVRRSRRADEDELTRSRGAAKKRRGGKAPSRRERFNDMMERLYEDSLGK